MRLTHKQNKFGRALNGNLCKACKSDLALCKCTPDQIDRALWTEVRKIVEND
jgi:hypothetical protein